MSKDTKKTLLDFISAWLPPFLWAGVIFAFSSQTVLPGFSVNTYDFILKKVAHIIVYGVLYMLVYRAVDMNIRPKSKKSPAYYLIPFVILLVYAISDELHQSLVPGRHATLRDVGYDSLGGMIAFFRIHGYI